MTWSVSDDFKAAMKASTVTPQYQIDVLLDNAIQTTLQGVLSGQMTADKSADTLRRGQFEFLDTIGDLTPADATDLMAPKGTEFRIWAGLKLPNGSVEWVPQITGPISNTQVIRSEGLVLRADGDDHSKKVQRAKSTDTVFIPAGSNISQVIQDIIAARVPNIDYRFWRQPHECPDLIYPINTDMWKVCQDLAASIGSTIYFDQMGSAVLWPEVDPSGVVPIWSYMEGEEAQILSVEKTWSNSDNYNHVIVDASHVKTAPVRGEAIDNDPNSPSYIYGPFGDVVDYIQDSAITSQVQAQEAASARLFKVKGLMEKVNFPATPNYALDIDDGIFISSAGAKINNTYLIDTITTVYGAQAPQNAVTRVRTLT